MNSEFLSTLSLRRATRAELKAIADRYDFYPRSPCGERPGKGPTVKGYWNFYPRSPCGERHLQRQLYEANSYISIHALLAESDSASFWNSFLIPYFYPRSPCGERQQTAYFFSADGTISIHALLAESDKSLFTSVVSSIDFYPRSPCGERPLSHYQL